MKYPMEELLAQMSKTSFARLTEIYGVVWNAESTRRKRAIDTLIRRIVNAQALYYQSLEVGQEEWDRYLASYEEPILMDDEGEPADHLYALYFMGFLYKTNKGDKPVFVMPGEINDLIHSDEWKLYEPRVRINNEVFDCACAAVNLYGAISMDDFTLIYEKFFGHGYNKTMLLNILYEFCDIGVEDFYVWRDYLLNIDFFDEEDDYALPLLSEAREKPRYLPSKEEFMRYADYTYVDMPPAMTAMKAFLERALETAGDDEDDADAKMLLFELYQISRDDLFVSSVQDAVELLDEFDIKFDTQKQLREFLGLFTDMQNNTRLWRNNGHTPMELGFLMTGSPRIAANTQMAPATPATSKPSTKKADRNAPCPCGSGKKYKNCCGKADNIIEFPKMKQ